MSPALCALSRALHRGDNGTAVVILPRDPSHDHRTCAQTLPILRKPIARAAPRERSMSRPRVNGPRSLMITTTEAPVRGLVTITLVPNGNRLCAAAGPLVRKARPPAIVRPGLYCAAAIDPWGQSIRSENATAADP